ncbi:hypothetical protein [Bacillus sp. B1-b2]|nr:hypothetical protein [Bacillus sp. B1-b2]
MQLLRADIDQVLKDSAELAKTSCLWDVFFVEIDKLLEETKDWIEK